MKRWRYILAGIGAILVLNAPVVRAQVRTARAETWGFVNVRYDTRSSGSIYTGYGWRRAFAMGGMVQNQRTGNAEMLGGVGGVFRTGANAEHWFALATAQNRGASFAQAFWLPTIRIRGVTTRAQVKWTIPQDGSAPQRLSISPVSMTMPVTRRLAAGMAVDMAAAEGALTSTAVGPQLRLKLPRAALTADALRDVTRQGSGARLRVLFGSYF